MAGCLGPTGAFDGIARLAAEAGSLGRGHLSDVGSTFDQKNIGFAGLKQAVGNAAAHGTAADNDVFRV